MLTHQSATAENLVIGDGDRRLQEIGRQGARAERKADHDPEQDRGGHSNGQETAPTMPRQARRFEGGIRDVHEDAARDRAGTQPRHDGESVGLDGRFISCIYTLQVHVWTCPYYSGMNVWLPSRGFKPLLLVAIVDVCGDNILYER